MLTAIVFPEGGAAGVKTQRSTSKRATPGPPGSGETARILPRATAADGRR
jgi:hypothetical protein